MVTVSEMLGHKPVRVTDYHDDEVSSQSSEPALRFHSVELTPAQIEIEDGHPSLAVTYMTG